MESYLLASTPQLSEKAKRRLIVIGHKLLLGTKFDAKMKFTKLMIRKLSFQLSIGRIAQDCLGFQSSVDN